MSSNRYISTSFYDDAWVSELDPSEKFMYLYLITNALTNIAGVYKITKKRISFDTGFNIDTVSHILNRFESVKKACLCNEYMIIPSFPKNQSLNENMKKGLVDIVSKLPEEVLEKMNELNYSYDISAFLPKKEPFESLSNPSNYSNLNSNTNSNLNLDTETDVSDNSSSVANAPSSEFANDESAKVSEDNDDTSSSPTISEESHTHSDNTKSNTVSSSKAEEKKVIPSGEKEFWDGLGSFETPQIEPKAEKKPRNYFKVPTIGEIAQYISENNYLVDAEGFYHYYRDRNWCAGRKKIDWKDKVRQWDLDRRAKGKGYGYKKQPASPYNLDIKTQSFNEEDWK